MAKSIEQLISKRAKGRTSSHFTNGPSEAPPAGFKPHPKPLLLSYGTPNNGFFPIDSLDINLVNFPFEHLDKYNLPQDSLQKLSISIKNGNDTNGQSNKNIDTKKEEFPTFQVTRHFDDPNLTDLSTGLQYAAVEGHTPLLEFTKNFITRAHKPANNEWGLIITTGASDGLNKAVDAVLDNGDVILIEEFTFTPFLRFVDNAGAIPIPVKIDLSSDSNGLDLDHLQSLLENWQVHHKDLPKPKALYTIATGQNPTGFTQSVEFRKKVYLLAQKHDLIIIEDDPYGYLTLPKYEAPSKDGFETQFRRELAKLAKQLTIDEYLKDHLTPSYLELDLDGRVIRVETFSKLFAPGLRLGFIIAHQKIINVIKNYAEVINRGASGVAQLIVNDVIQGKLGGVDGWLNWILKMRATYLLRKDLLVHTILQSEAYKQGLVDIIDPKAGMFVTFKIKFLDGRPEDEIVDKVQQLFWKIISYGVSVVPGNKMTVDAKFSASRSNFFRLCYAPANNDEDLVESGKRLTEAVLEFYKNGEKF